MRTIRPALIAACVAAATFAAGAEAVRADVLGQMCAAAKIKATSKKTAAKLNCYRKAVRQGGSVDPVCLARAEGRFSSAFAKAEMIGGCHTTGDQMTIETKVDNFVGDVVSELPPSCPTQTPVAPNLVGNPGFEINTCGWNTNSSYHVPPVPPNVSGVTLSRVAGGQHSGNWQAKLTNTGGVSGTCSLNDSPDWVGLGQTQAGTYTACIYVRADVTDNTHDVHVKLTEYVGTTSQQVCESAPLQLTVAWQQVCATCTPLMPGASFLDLHVEVPSASCPPNFEFFADDASITHTGP